MIRRVAFVAAVLFVSMAGAAELPADFDKAIAARPIGPANMSGRVTAIAVVEKRPATMYVGAASGGVWKTVNNGITWTPVFDGQKSHSIGDVAVAPSNAEIVWVGTGESNARNSVSWGDGVYKSVDGGKTWQNMGLRDTQHIGRIIIHPTNPDVVYVAALGHIWAPNKERGLFRTTDGGKTWECVKFIDEETGFIDLAMDPNDAETLYAAAYRVRRDGFSGPNPQVLYGPAAGLYKTTDAGKTWKRLTKGLPDGPIGRCGISIYRKNPNVLFAQVQTDKTDIRVVAGQPPKQNDEPSTGGIFRSDDRGETWVKLNDLCPRPFYFSQIRVDPNDDQRVYVCGVTLFVSVDGGKKFAGGAAPGVHADQHALWIDPADSDHHVIGCDGGLYVTYDRGANWEHFKNLPISQFYGVGVDMRKPYRVYGGLQDNGTWGGPSRTKNREGIGTADWFRIFGADGFQVAPDPNDVDTVYAEWQYGRFLRINVSTGHVTTITPAPVEGAPAYRFNWNAPMQLSAFDSKTVYFAGNHVFRSTDRGVLWEVLGPDLTRGTAKSPLHAHTISALTESPRKQGLLYVGSDDGVVHVSRNGGSTWIDISDRLPDVAADRHITKIECSPHADGTAFLSLSRHRNDDHRPYLLKTEDAGVTWKSIAANLPADGPVHVIRCDPRNASLLYVGTEFGLFVSANGGASWQPFKAGLPPVPVHDLVIHPRDRELVIGTHGRGIYIVDCAPLQELSAKNLAAPIYLCAIKPAQQFEYRAGRGEGQGKHYLAPNPEYGAAVYYHFKDKPTGDVGLIVYGPDGDAITSLNCTHDAGLHHAQWYLTATKDDPKNPKPVKPGEYTVVLHAGGQSLSQKVRVEAEE
jgi:photosystem II stability/assembly factor-like uncharacterized protein